MEREERVLTLEQNCRAPPMEPDRRSSITVVRGEAAMLTRVMSEVHSRRSARTGGTAPSGALALGDLIFAKLLDRSFHAPVRRLPADAHLYSWGDCGDWLYLVQSGWVKSMTWSWGGKPCVLEINGPSALL